MVVPVSGENGFQRWTGGDCFHLQTIGASEAKDKSGRMAQLSYPIYKSSGAQWEII